MSAPVGRLGPDGRSHIGFRDRVYPDGDAIAGTIDASKAATPAR